jgi:ABC-type oligopeptide transport system substrate-binding subunit
MKKVTIGIMAILMTLLLFSPMFAEAKSPRHCKGLDVYFYASDDKAFGALIAGEVDFCQWSLTYEQYLDACESPDFQLAGYAENGIYGYALNNNYTIAAYPGIRSPMNDVLLRKAIAHSVDKDYYVHEIIRDFAEGLTARFVLLRKDTAT